jgi:predicted RNA-binding protein
MDTSDETKEMMKDVARIQAEGRGFWLINLFGERRFVEGNIDTISLVDGHFVIIQNQ